MTETKKEELRRLKGSETNHGKGILMQVQSQLELISPRDAESLGKIIERLERWQHK